MSILFLIVVLAALIAVLPRWTFSQDWGYGPAIGMGLVLIVTIMVVLVNGWEGGSSVSMISN